MNIIQTNTHILTHEDGTPVHFDEQVTNFRGEPRIVRGGEPPHKADSTGRIYVSEPGSHSQQGFYPSVCDLVWKRKAD